MIAQLINGVFVGGEYALAAIGMTFMLGIARVVNFAYGAFYMIAAFGTATVMSGLGLPYAVAAIIAVVGVALLGWPLTRFAVLPVIKRDEENVLISTLAVSIIATNVALHFFGGQVTFIDSPFNDVKMSLAEATVSVQQILGLVVALVVATGLTIYLKTTTLGTRIRAVANNPSLAEASGISVKRVFLIAVCIGITIAAIAGVIASPTGVITVFMGDSVLLTAFTIAALAGMGKIWGAVVVGISVGVGESLLSIIVAPAYISAITYAVLVLVLLFFPKGVFAGE